MEFSAVKSNTQQPHTAIQRDLMNLMSAGKLRHQREHTVSFHLHTVQSQAKVSGSGEWLPLVGGPGARGTGGAISVSDDVLFLRLGAGCKGVVSL